MANLRKNFDALKINSACTLSKNPKDRSNEYNAL
jgi:hypothetical protein